MEFRKIKDGMLIHCISETEATALLGHLSGLGYVWDDGVSIQQTGWHYHREDTCYKIKTESKQIHLTSTEGQRPGTVIYFYDLILPEGCAEEVSFKDLQPGAVVHCGTEKGAKTFCKHLAEIGYSWEDSDIPLRLDERWRDHKQYSGYLLQQDRTVRLLDLSVHSSVREQIVEYDDLVEYVERVSTDWELAAEVLRMDRHETDKFNHMFVGHGAEYVLSNYSPAQVREIMMKYDIQHKVKIGDIVTVGKANREFLVTKTEDGIADGIDKHGGTMSYPVEAVTPTGKSSNIAEWMINVFSVKSSTAFGEDVI